MTLQILGGTAADFTSGNPVLEARRQAYETDTGKMKVGDGTTAWNSLPYFGASGVTDGDKGDITVSGSGATWTIDPGVVTLGKLADMATASLFYRKTAGAGAPEVQTLATLKTDLGLTGTNSGDQSSIVGISGTKAQFDTAVTDGNFLFSGDVTQYTDEAAQDAIGAALDASLVYNDTTPQFSRAALTGAITAAQGSNATALGSFTKAQLDAAVSDGNVLYVGDVTSNATHTGEVTGSTALTIAADAVTNAKLANMPAATIKGNNTGSAADPADLTVAQVKTLLAYVTADIGAQPLDADLTALAALTGTNTIYYRSAADTWSPVTIGANLTFSGGTLDATGGGGSSVSPILSWAI